MGYMKNRCWEHNIELNGVGIEDFQLAITCVKGNSEKVGIGNTAGTRQTFLYWRKEKFAQVLFLNRTCVSSPAACESSVPIVVMLLARIAEGIEKSKQIEIINE